MIILKLIAILVLSLLGIYSFWIAILYLKKAFKPPKSSSTFIFNEKTGKLE